MNMTYKKWNQPKGKPSNKAIGSTGKSEPDVGDMVLFEPNGHTYKLTGIVVAPYKRDTKGKQIVTGYLLTKGNSTIEASPEEIRW